MLKCLKQLSEFLLLGFLIILMTTSLSAENIVEKTLSNGLHVILVQDEQAPLVSVRTYVRAGSIDEAPHLGSGLSHYLEHIVAGGTTQARSEKDYTDWIALLGGAYNAYTTSDHTSYYLNTTPEKVNDAISILNEWMFQNVFDELEYNRERDVIIREIEKNNASIPRKFYQLSSMNFYKYNPYRYPVIGYLENFKSVTRDELVAYYKSRYTPSNMVLVVGGDINIQEVENHIIETFGQAEERAPAKIDYEFEPKPFGKRIVEEEDETSVTYLSIKFATVDLNHPDLYPLDLLDYILGNGEESLLYKRLVDETKLAYSLSVSSFTPQNTQGYFDITAEIDYENKDAVIDEISQVISDVKRGKVEAGFIKRAKKQKIADDILSISSIEDKVSKYGQSYLFGYSTHFFQDYTENFKHVSGKDLERVANKYFDFDRTVVTILKPKNTAKSELDKKISKTREPELITLENGVRIIYEFDDTMPKISSRIFVLGGMRAEGVSNNGIGHFVADLLGTGSSRYKKEAINQMIEDNGASLQGGIGQNTIYYSLSCLSEDTPFLYPLQLETFVEAYFDQTEFEESKRKTLKSIEQRYDDWYRSASYQFKKTFYHGHPYGLSVLGEKESIEKLTAREVQNHFESMLNPDQMILSIYGDISKEDAVEIAERYLGKLPAVKDDLLTSPLPRIVNKTEKTISLSLKQDVAVAFVAFEGLEITQVTDNLKLDLVDTVLAGMSYPGGRLHPLLRGEGLVYVVHGVDFSGLEKGHFMIYALTTPDQLDRVVTIISQQIEDIKQNPISEKEFNEAIAQMKFYYQDRLGSGNSKAAVMATDELYGMGYDHYKSIQERIDALTIEDVRDTANKILVEPQTYLFNAK